MDLKLRWVLKLLSNIGILKAIPFLFGELADNTKISVSGYPDKMSVVKLLENEYLIYLHHEELGVWFFHQ